MWVKGRDISGNPGESVPMGSAGRSADLSNMRVLILNEPMYPSELAAELRALGAEPDLVYIQPDHRMSLAGLGLTATGGGGAEGGAGNEVQDTNGPTASSVKISPTQRVLAVVIDTGVDTGHEIFEGRLHEAAPKTPTDSLSYSHGTHVSATAIDTAKGAGAEVELLPIRVIGNGFAYTSDVIAAIGWASSLGARIINLSMVRSEERV